MKLYLALAVCIALCRGQEIEVEPDVSVDSGECQQFCREGRRCPSTTAIITTIFRLSQDCRGCIMNECGSGISQANRTQVADCWYATRIECGECVISNGTRNIREQCISCIDQCNEQIAAGNSPTLPPTARPVRPVRPGFGSPFIISPGLTGGRPGRFGSVSGRRPSPFGNFKPPFGRPQGPNPFGVVRCTCRDECTVPSPTVACRQCVASACRNASQQGGAFTACIQQARMSCEECGNRTDEDMTRMQCNECINRCRGQQQPGRVGGRGGAVGGMGGPDGMGGPGGMVRPRGMVRPGGMGGPGGMVRPGGMGGGRSAAFDALCNRDCIAPGFCPSTDSIINTISSSPPACQMCIRDECGEVVDNNRDEVAECMYEARLDCQECGLNSAARFQRRRCNFCRMTCEEDEIDMGTDGDTDMGIDTDMGTDGDTDMGIDTDMGTDTDMRSGTDMGIDGDMETDGDMGVDTNMELPPMTTTQSPETTASGEAPMS